MAAAIWWLLFWTAAGLCVGSFLNVVLYRLPRQQSILNPRWSHCPHCSHRIRWYDNLPVLSYLLLGGRCRDCRQAISVRYPIVEALTACIVLVVFDAFFVSRTRVGLSNESFLMWSLLEDWPIYLAHVVLMSCLLAMAAIDLQFYWVDIRFTTLATWAGVGLHLLWTPPHSTDWFRPSEAVAAGSFGALVGLIPFWLWLRYRGQPEEVPENPHEAGSPPAPADSPSNPPESIVGTDPTQVASPVPTAPTGDFPESAESGGITIAPPVPKQPQPRLAVAILAAAALLGLLIWVAADAISSLAANQVPAPSWRAGLVIGLSFLLIFVDASVARESDQQIEEAIELERSSARKVALVEFAWLLPAILAGAAAVWLVQSGGQAASQKVASLLHWSPAGSWRPLWGLSTAISGLIIGGGIGWLVRIFFTLFFGKEAFGTGDIHIMAAAGCVAGWPVVLMGFWVTVFLALGAWLLLLPMKRTRAIPLVPWLALGYLIVVVFYEPLLRFTPVHNALIVIHMLTSNNSHF